MPKEPLLSEHELLLPSTQKIMRYLENRLASLRAGNDNPDHDEITTALDRGGIREILKCLGAFTITTKEVGPERFDPMSH